MINKREIRTRWKAVLLLVLFMAYYSDVSLFTHTHIIHGTTIVHSHWHMQQHHKSADGGHRSHDITLIANLSKYLCLEGTLDNSCPAPAVHWLMSTKVEYSGLVTTAYQWVKLLRAPPVGL